MCNSEQPFIQQNICELLEKVKQCCLSKEEVSNLRQQIDSVQLWINSFDKLSTNDIVTSEPIGDFPENTSIQEILQYLYDSLTIGEETIFQEQIQFKNQGVNLGVLGAVETINFTGSSVTATLVGNVLTVDITGGSGGGVTNLDYVPSSTQGVVTSDTGADAIIPLADGTNAGLFAPSEKTKLGFITITQNVNLDQLESDTVTNNAKVTNATHTGDVTGATVLTLATVNSNVGTFGSTTQIPVITTNGKGLITAVSLATIAPTASSITGAGNISKVDDTNVTLSLGGTPVGSVLNNVSFTLGWTGTLSIARGGTGLSALGTANQQLRVNAGGTALEFFTPSSTGITSFNGITTGTQTFANDTNVTIVSAGSTHTVTWVGTLSDSRITSANNWNKSYQQNKIRVVSVNTTLSATTDGTVVFDTAGTIATLPSSVSETILTIKNSSNGSISVSGNIDGIVSNYTLSSKESMRFHGNGVTWYYIG